MDIKINRLYIVKEKNDHFIAVDSRKQKYKILKNDYSNKFKKNEDREIYYSIQKKGLYSTTINPISHQQYLELECMVS